MKQRLVKQSLAWCLTLLMLFSLIPSTAFAKQEYAGYLYFTVEKITLNQGCIVEPTKVGYYADDNVAKITERLLAKFGTKNTGTVDNGYYLSYVKDGGNPVGWTKEQIPQKIVDARGGLDEIEGRSEDGYLGEFDYTNASGWMYTINNIDFKVGASGYKPGDGEQGFQNGDVIRLMYTLHGYGGDLGIGWGTNLISFADKCELIKKLADMKADEKISEYETEYAQALQVMNDWDATQNEVNIAIEVLDGCDDNAGVPSLGQDETRTIDLAVAEEATLHLDNIFTNPKSVLLQYFVSEDKGANWIKMDSEVFHFSPKVSGTNVFWFKVSDGKNESDKFKLTVIASDYAEVEIPYADIDQDQNNDFRLDYGTLTKYFVYSYQKPESMVIKKAGMDGNTLPYDIQVLRYQAENKGNFYYRCSNQLDKDVVAFGKYYQYIAGGLPEKVTKKQLYAGTDEGSKQRNQDTVISDLSLNKADVADVYLTINAKGYINMNQGTDFKFYAFRNWLPVESFMNSQVIEPDFHYKVIDIEGTNIIEINKDQSLTSSRNSATITAKKSGTALVLVTYDAVSNANGYRLGGTDPTFFSAIWPENTGVFVVSVDQENGISSNMNLNTGKNSETVKLSKDAIDSEHDILYYTGTKGASYSFTPEMGVTATVMRPEYKASDGQMKFSGSFSTKGVSADEKTGQITIDELYEGSSIVRLKKGSKIDYQILKAKKLDYTILINGEKREKLVAKPGDKVSIEFNRVYHPANKLSGAYNMNALLQYQDESGNSIKSKSNQYVFAGTREAQTINFEIPVDYKKSEYSLIDGAIYVSGYGYGYGCHRQLTYENGKQMSMASANNGYLSMLPDVTVAVEQKSERGIENIYHETASFMTSLGIPIVGSIGGEWSIIGLARSGQPVPENYYDQYYNNVVTKMIECKGKLHRVKYTEYSRVALALAAIGKDVNQVAGYPLLENLKNYKAVCKQGLNGEIFALIAIDASTYQRTKKEDAQWDVTRKQLLDGILEQEVPGGGWDLMGKKADTDISAMTLQALAPYVKSDARVKAAADRAVEILSKMQLENGGIPAWGGVETSESAAQVVVALCALGINPAQDTRFIKNGMSLMDRILLFHIENSGFSHVFPKSLNGMATEQAYYAITAYMRMVKGQTSLYDMSDLKEVIPVEEPATQPNEKPIEKAVEAEMINQISKTPAIVAAVEMKKADVGVGKKENKVKPDVQSGELKDSSTGIAVSGVPERAKLSVSVIPLEETNDVFNRINKEYRKNYKDAQLLLLCELQLDDLNTGKKIELQDGVQITIPIPKSTEKFDSYMIVHEKHDGTVEYVSARIEDDKLVFILTSLSPVGIIGCKNVNEKSTTKSAQVDSVTAKNMVDEQKTAPFWIIIGAVLIATTGGALVFQKKRKKA